MHLIDMILNAWTFVHLFQHVGIIAKSYVRSCSIALTSAQPGQPELINLSS
jgi:Na+-translocating ferredoxin:NAD+ oxidoreductase RnfE subunit